MIRKTHKGQKIDMESLILQNEKSVAMGNMGTNAKGDKLGKDGAVVQTSQQRTRKHYVAPKKTSSVGIKEEIEEKEVFPDEKPAAKKPAAKRGRRKVEKETESGDIIMEEADDNET